MPVTIWRRRPERPGKPSDARAGGVQIAPLPTPAGRDLAAELPIPPPAKKSSKKRDFLF